MKVIFPGPQGQRLVSANPENVIAKAMIAAGIGTYPVPHSPLAFFQADDWYLASAIWVRLGVAPRDYVFMCEALTDIVRLGRTHMLAELQRLRALEALG